MGLHRSTTCPSSADSDDIILNPLLHTLEDKDCNGKGRCSKSLDTFRIKLRPLKWKEQMQQEYRHLQDKAKAIEMERADVARV